MSARQSIWSGSAKDAHELAQIHAPIFPDPWPADAFASLLARPEVFVLIGAPRGATKSAGFVLVRVVADEAEILTLGVATRARRTGLGQALLDAGIKEALRRGAHEVFLEVGENNDAAIALYQAAGFGAVGRRRAYYQHGPEAADAIVMRKNLRTGKTAAVPGN